jgi:hypothetical protein
LITLFWPFGQLQRLFWLVAIRARVRFAHGNRIGE